MPDRVNIEKYYEKLYSPDYEKPDDVEEALARAESDIDDPQLHWIASVIAEGEFKIIHDFGCGFGRLLAVVHKLGMFNDSQFLYVGVDEDLFALNCASALAQKLSVSAQTTFLSVEQWQNHTIVKEQFSCLVCNDVIHHLHHSKFAALYSVFHNSMPNDSSLINAETALFKRLERQRVPLSNEDLEFFARRLRLRCNFDFAESPRKKLPLTRAEIKKPTRNNQSLTIQRIDEVFRETLLNKRGHLRARLNTAVLDKQFLSESRHYHTRIGMLEMCQSIDHIISHWSDIGYFSTFPKEPPKQYIERSAAITRLHKFIKKHPVCTIYGEFGVGKTVRRQSNVSYLGLKLRDTFCVSKV